MILASVPSAWAAGEQCSSDIDCVSGESCSLIGDFLLCTANGGSSSGGGGGLGSTCDASTVCGEHLACLQGICTFADPNNNNGGNGNDGGNTQVIPANGACEVFDFSRQCIADYFCNALSGTCESLSVQSCIMTTNQGSVGTGGCKPTQVCTPLEFLNSAAGAPGACITVEQDPNSHICSPACPSGQTCTLGICVADSIGGGQCSPACTAGKTCVAGVCVADGSTGSQCPTAGCGTGKSCVAGVCVPDVASCPTEGCGAGKSCVAGVCVTTSLSCPAAGCGAGKSCVGGVCVPDSVVPATCSASKPCTGTLQCVAGLCIPGTGAQNQCSPACTTGNTCINSVCVADGSAFTGTIGSRCDASHGCNTNLACFANLCIPSTLAAQAGGASAVHATVSVLLSLAIACVAALMTV